MSKMKKIIIEAPTPTPLPPPKTDVPKIDDWELQFSILKDKIEKVTDSEEAQKVKDEVEKFKEKVSGAAQEIKWKELQILAKRKVNQFTEKAQGWKEKNADLDTPDETRDYLWTHFEPCRGFNQNGCKSESIKKVQGCLGLTQSGNFDETLYNALGPYGWQNGFNDSDVNRVCDDIKRGPIPKQSEVVSPEEIKRREEEAKRLEAERKAEREMQDFIRQFPIQTTLPTETENWG